MSLVDSDKLEKGNHVSFNNGTELFVICGILKTGYRLAVANDQARARIYPEIMFDVTFEKLDELMWS